MSDELAKEWLQSKWPNMRGCDVDWTMKRYDYPDYVCEYIKNNWIKISDSGGGTYHEPEYHKERLVTKTEGKYDTGIGNSKELTEIIRNMVQGENPEEDDDGKGIAKLYQQTGFAKAMDENNKKALDVMAKEGMDAAVKHMFTDQKSGRQLSYAEMRSRYG